MLHFEQFLINLDGMAKFCNDLERHASGFYTITQAIKMDDRPDNQQQVTIVVRFDITEEEPIFDPQEIIQKINNGT